MGVRWAGYDHGAAAAQLGDRPVDTFQGGVLAELIGGRLGQNTIHDMYIAAASPGRYDNRARQATLGPKK